MTALLEQILSIVVSILTAVGIIRGQTEHVSQEHYKYELLGYAVANSTYLLDSSTGLAAIAAKLDALTNTGDYTLSDVLNAIADTQQAGVPVTLPDTLNSNQQGAAADAIWNYFFGSEYQNAAAMLTDAGRVAHALRQHGSYLPDTWTRLRGSPIDTDDLGNATPGGTVTVDPSDALAGESLVDYLNRVYPAWTWGWVSEAGGYAAGSNPDLVPQYATTTLTGLEWDALLKLRAGAEPLTTANTAPVWPGLSGVTLLTPVAISPPGDVIAVACHGVLVDITAVPSWAGSFDFGGDISYRNIGAISFQTDDAYDEFPIQLGWVAGVYLPKSMSSATKVVYRAAVGVTGTITPFTIP